jgi:hypothetical protein
VGRWTKHGEFSRLVDPIVHQVAVSLQAIAQRFDIHALASGQGCEGLRDGIDRQNALQRRLR